MKVCECSMKRFITSALCWCLCQTAAIIFHGKIHYSQMLQHHSQVEGDCQMKYFRCCKKHNPNLNSVKLNSYKTEFLLIGTKSKVNNFSLTVLWSIQALGVILNSTLSFHSHINSIIRSAHFHFRNIYWLRLSLSLLSASILVNILVISQIDYCNSLLVVLPHKSIR